MKIVCFGDSLTECGGENGRFSDILQDRFPRHTVVNRGIGGQTWVDAMPRLQADVLDERPDVVLIEYGANDWWRDERPMKAWAADLESCVRQVQAAGARPVILGVFGLYRNAAGELVPKVYGIDDRAVAYRKQEQRIAAQSGCPYVPNIQERIIEDRCCWLDRNHPNELGNRFVADTIEPVLEQLLGERALPVRKPHLRTTRDFWREAVALAPGSLAAVDGARRLTYGEAGQQVERLAAGMAAVTGSGRPKVAVYLPNGLEYFLAYWAVQQLGGVIVPLNTWLKEDAIAGIFRSVQPDILIVRGAQDQVALRALADSGVQTAVFAVDQEATASDAGLSRFAGLLESEGTMPDVPLSGEDLSIIMHTSGTTSMPKGAMMRHTDLMFNAAAAINAHGFCPSDVHLLVNPMFHCTALYSSLPTAAYQKTPVIITASSAPAELMELVQRERITTFLSVPTVFQKLLSLPNLHTYDATSLRVMAYAGSPMPVPVVKELRQQFPGVALHNFFGLTETISMTHVLRNDDVETRPDSIGRLLPFVDARVVDSHDQALPAGAVGELLFAREEVIPGYYNQPEKLREALVTIDGREWFRTGDLAMVDEEGYFFIKGRKKDMIIVGGENVFAAEVEGVLLAAPGVQDAAVKGVPATGIRAHLGELVQAYVVAPGVSEATLRRHCAERLPSYKCPVFYRFVDTLPRNPAGKVVKDQLPQ